MGFFKESGSTTSSKSIARLQQLIWILIYGGLLTLVLGLSVQRIDDALGWSMVVAGSVKRDGVEVRFVVTDTAKTIPVTYRGALPDLFREGKGVVAQGQLGADGVFAAKEVLAKHDENYMPPDAKHALDKATSEKAQKTLQR